jgi:hypothetical protein
MRLVFTAFSPRAAIIFIDGAGIHSLASLREQNIVVVPD